MAFDSNFWPIRSWKSSIEISLVFDCCWVSFLFDKPEPILTGEIGVVGES
jgi:hypothetical protein